MHIFLFVGSYNVKKIFYSCLFITSLDPRVIQWQLLAKFFQVFSFLVSFYSTQRTQIIWQYFRSGYFIRIYSGWFHVLKQRQDKLFGLLSQQKSTQSQILGLTNINLKVEVYTILRNRLVRMFTYNQYAWWMMPLDPRKVSNYNLSSSRMGTH